MTWEEREKKADIRVEVVNGPDWALSVLHGVVSSVLSSSVVLCWSQCDWLQLGSRCDSSTGSVGSPSASVGSVFFLKYVVLEAMDSPEKEKKKKTQYGMDKGFDNSHVVGLQSTGVRHLLYREMSVWVDAVSSLGVSLHLVLVRALACCHVSVAFFFCLKMGGQAVKVGGRGPSVAQCPELATLGSVRCLRGSCAGMQE